VIGLQGVQFIGLGIRCGDRAAIAVENESASRFADRKLGEKIRYACKLDDDGENAHALLIDIDRACKRDRRPFAPGMCAQLEPLLVIGLACLAIPFLLGDDVAGFRKAPLPKFDVEARVFVPIDAHL